MDKKSGAESTQKKGMFGFSNSEAVTEKPNE